MFSMIELLSAVSNIHFALSTLCVTVDDLMFSQLRDDFAQVCTGSNVPSRIQSVLTLLCILLLGKRNERLAVFAIHFKGSTVFVSDAYFTSSFESSIVWQLGGKTLSISSKSFGTTIDDTLRGRSISLQIKTNFESSLFNYRGDDNNISTNVLVVNHAEHAVYIYDFVTQAYHKMSKKK